MNETPSTFLEWFDTHPGFSLVLFAALTIVGIALIYIFARLLIGSLQNSAKADQPLTTLMLILGTVSIVALIGALFTNNESAFTIAATGVGAFAGALSAGAQKAITGEFEDKTPAPVIYPVPLGPAEPEPEPKPESITYESESSLSEYESEGVVDDDDWDNDEDSSSEESEYVFDDEDLAEAESESTEENRG